MKKIIKGFTLIEILIVISIIAIVSTVSINSFFNLTKNNNTKNMLLEISWEIKELDLKIKNYEIFDYEIIFDTNNINSYIVYENIFNENQNQKITSLTDYDFNITLNWLNWELWNYEIYQDIKLIINNNEAISNNLVIARDISYNYKILWKLELSWDEKHLNNILINVFDNNNLDLKIEKITLEESSIDIWYVKIVNIWWKKHFLDSDNNNIISDQIYLHFEEWWRENYLIINKI